MATTQNIREIINTYIYPGPIRGEELPYEDGEPLESQWHLDAMHLLIRILRYYYRQGDVFVGGNMSVYFDPDQQKNKNFHSPYLFLVKGVSDLRPRTSWVVWEEGLLTPDVVIELTSPSTAKFDVTGKKEIYEQILETSEYVVYNPNTRQLRGWRLTGGQYCPITPNKKGWLWLNELELWLGLTDYTIIPNTPPLPMLWLFDKNGNLIPSPTEKEAQQAIIERLRAEDARQQAQEALQQAQQAEKEARQAKQKAEKEREARLVAEAEIVRLKALLEEKGRN
ncbi:Uma2 family endonuclease [Anaerolineales bacterium HSG24]|nr:Uma2 family endonuclease [Anaerolineales bacterium HSG24]